jgi:hypothetical protein
MEAGDQAFSSFYKEVNADLKNSAQEFISDTPLVDVGIFKKQSEHSSGSSKKDEARKDIAERKDNERPRTPGGM